MFINLIVHTKRLGKTGKGKRARGKAEIRFVGQRTYEFRAETKPIFN